VLRTDDPDVAAAALAEGHLAALPTETVYGLGARADLPRAVAQVYAAKGRPADHPLIVHLLDPYALLVWGVDLPEWAGALAEVFWPGPMTLVVRRSDRAGDFVTGGQDTVALRVPAHPGMRAVLRALGERVGDDAVGIAAPSANRFGRVSPTTADHVLAELGDVLGSDDVLLDGGPSAVGVESTIVDCTGDRPVILRPGRVATRGVEAVTGLTCGERSAVRAPGTLASHYAPRARVRLVDAADLAEAVGGLGVPPARTGVLALAEVATPPGVVRLAAPADVTEYAQVLYAALREADALELEAVVAVPPDDAGIGEAVADRLRRAAH